MLKIKNLTLYLMLLLVSAVTFTACDGDNLDIDDDTTITEFVASESRFSTLTAALERTGLTSVLDGEDKYTVFAPNDAAFNALGINLDDLSDDDLRNVLLQHVVFDKQIGDLTITFENRYFTSEATGPNGAKLSILLKDEGDDLMVNGVRVISDDEIDVENGVIYEIGQVLLPKNLVEMALIDEDLSELVAALGKADGDLVNVLSSADDNFTVFAPENDAFEDIMETVNGLTTEQLATVLTYHVVAGNFQSTDLTDEQIVTTVNGETIALEIDGDDVTIRDAEDNEVEVKIANVQTTNGVIHIIKEVLMPSSL
ncbi:MAG: fasciclin domain-containing protein [Saprospiraceae bacterium]